MAARVDLGAGGEVVGELEALVDGASAARGAVGLADHGALPGGPTGRCARGVRAGAARCWSTSSASSRARRCAALEQQVLQQSPDLDASAARPLDRARQPAADPAAPRRPRRTTSSRCSARARRTPAGDRRRPGRRRQDPARPARSASRPDAARWCLAGAARRRRRPTRPSRRWWPRRCTSPAVNAALRERLVRRRHRAAARQLRARRRRRGRCWCSPCSTRCPSCGCSRPARCRWASRRSTVHAARAADPRNVGHAVRPSGAGDAASARSLDAETADGGRGRRVPVPRRAAAGDRARRRPGAVAVGARHRPAARRPVRPAARPQQPPARAPTRAGRRHRVELRAAVPRRPARAVGAVLLRRQRLPGRGRARAGGARRAGGVGARHGRTGSSTGRWSAWTPLEGGEVRYRLLDSIRAYAAERLQRVRPGRGRGRAHAGWYAATAAWCDAHVRSAQQPACLAVARAERANVDVALAWCAAHDPPLGVRIANGFGWTWVVLGDGTAGAARVRNALFDQAPARDRATGVPARRLARGIGRQRRARPGRPRRRPVARRASSRTRCSAPTSTGTRRSWPSSRAVPTSCSAPPRPAWRRTGLAGLRWQTAGSLLLGGVRGADASATPAQPRGDGDRGGRAS